ncbi:carbohydrate ABC transporter permease [Inquilinus limosus]|uniref:carbohydrate ABC transporter permease n=1 Tax=Inquilinus limosus TaxID=171674 RepID=UPI001C533FFE|nr:carbohydrate ABC transporter permease [Inquilinus limosus]
MLVIGALAMIYPLIWMVLSSFKSDQEIFSNPAALPTRLDLDNYIQGWTAATPSFTRYFINSFAICLGAVIGNVFACSLVAFAFARLRFPLKGVLFTIMLLTLMLPSHALLIPQYVLYVGLDWVNTTLPLIVPKFLATDAFFIFLMVQFIRTIPRELDEAATIDGCGTFALFRHIIFPLLRPAIITTIIFTFIWTYNDFFSQLIYLTSPESLTVPVALRSLVDSSGGAYAQLLAMSVLSLVPTFVVFLVFQRRLVEGISTSGIKG